MSRSWVIRPTDALKVLCAQLKRDLFAIAKFLFVWLQTSWPIGVKVCMMVELCPGKIFYPVVAISLGVTRCRVKKRAQVDHCWPLRHQFLPFDHKYLESQIDLNISSTGSF